MKRIGSLLVVSAFLAAGCAVDASSPEQTGSTTGEARKAQRLHSAEDFIETTAKPIVIGHEGAGENFGTDPSKPIHDTVASVTLAYEQGASVVEVDAEITKDGYAVAYHDFDFLQDYTCINSYTLAELQAKVPYIPRLDDVLKVAQQQKGVMIVELKTPSPMCDPGDTSEQAVVRSVLRSINATHTEERVVFDAFSPALLYIAKTLAPEIPRELDFSILQLMTPEQVQANTGMTVTQIDKSLSLGLRWANVGPAYRLPGYDSIQQFFYAAKVVDAKLVGAEKDFIGYSEATAPGSVAQFVGAAHSLGFKAVADPAKSALEFGWFASFGFDAAYCDDIPASLALQPAKLGD